MTSSSTLPTYVTAVTVYGDFPCRTIPIAEVESFCATHGVTLMLGAMRLGYLGREMVTLEDVDRWLHDDDEAAQWSAVAGGDVKMQRAG